MTTPDGPWQRLDRPPLRAVPLRRALTEGDRPAWRAIEVVTTTGSTNADLAARALAGEAEGLVITADEQRAGRGRHDRTWTAPPRAAISVSVLLRPPVPPQRWSWLSLLAGVAVTDALTGICGLPATLKWPNDVLVPAVPGAARSGGDQLKVGGILAEVAGDAVVLGIGLNVSQDADELPVPTATSLRLVGAATTDRDTVLRAVLRALSDRYRRWCDAAGDPRASGVAAAYRERCHTLGQRVRVQLPGGEAVEGQADGVDDDGRLLVRDDGGHEHALVAGDVVHVRPATGGPATRAEPA